MNIDKDPPKSQAERNQRWRKANPKKYREYMRRYMRKWRKKHNGRQD